MSYKLLWLSEFEAFTAIQAKTQRNFFHHSFDRRRELRFLPIMTIVHKRKR